MRRVVRKLVTQATGGNLQAARLLLLGSLASRRPVPPDSMARLGAAEAQADDAPPPLPADREACQDLAARPDTDLHRTLERLADPEARLNLVAWALAQEIRAWRGVIPALGDAGEPALESFDPPR